jgi:hypothetical protein
VLTSAGVAFTKREVGKGHDAAGDALDLYKKTLPR